MDSKTKVTDPFPLQVMQGYIINETKLKEISFRDVLLKLMGWGRYILNKWKIVLLFVILGAITGIIYAIEKEPVFIARSTFVLEEGGSSISQYAGIASLVGIDLGGNSGRGIFQGDNIIELYKSRAMIQKTLLTSINMDGTNQLLINRYILINQLRETWEKDAKLRNIQFDTGRMNRMQDSILGRVANDINQKYLFVGRPDKRLGIIAVEVKSKDEIFSKFFNEAIVKTVNDFYVSTKTMKSVENLNILQKHADSIQDRFNNAVSAIATNIDANPNANLSRLSLKVPSQLKQVSAEANRGILTELIKNIEFAKIALLRETPLIQFVDQPVFPLEKQQPDWLRSAIKFGLLLGFLVAFILLMKKILGEILST